MSASGHSIGLSPQDRDAVASTISKAVAALCSLQKPDGHWCAELEGDSILQSEYILMKWILGQERQPMVDGRDGVEVMRKLTTMLRRQRRPDGGWGQYPGSGVDLSATVKGYFCLKLAGDDPNSPEMLRTRDLVRSMGGAERCNSFTNFYLAALGQISWEAVPAIPPELVWLPKWFYFHMDKMSAWSRTMILPLAIVTATRPTRELPSDAKGAHGSLSSGIDELFVDHDARHRLKLRDDVPRFWKLFFGSADRFLKWAQAHGGSPKREQAIQAALDWILERAGQDGPAATDGLGAIFPPMVYIQIVFKALGYDREHPLVQRAERELDEFMIEGHDGETIRFQPCFSPVWDTGIALYALADCGLHESDSARDAASWLRRKEVHFTGDWINNVPSAKADPKADHKSDVSTGGAWFFEYENAYYPDCDDTAMVAMSLRRCGGESNLEASARGIRWLFQMQNKDGGWAAFDRTEDRRILEYIPFADHNAIQDPSCPDITGRVLECLSWHGYRNDHPVVRRAIDYVQSHQRPEGCWFGRWGVNYIYGTWQAVIGPIRCGEDRQQEWIQRAGRWMKSIQKSDGSFGETANSYEDISLMGTGPSTASQTAWAAMVLQEIYGKDDPDLQRAIQWLCRSQLSDADAPHRERNPDGDPAGSWVETEFTGTGFPRVFYLRYHLYRLYFPLMAIGRFARAHQIESRPTFQRPAGRSAPLVGV
ncbi:MAG: squalene--hopene cyclase [Phycisphaerae bacterium]|jgi:squalene-hopene/tetraprenyl-beta-curcumene cyclase|nr:squalene--hopene cyclase [Phycisphaerae bacterium]